MDPITTKRILNYVHKTIILTFIAKKYSANMQHRYPNFDVSRNYKNRDCRRFKFEDTDNVQVEAQAAIQVVTGGKESE